MPKLNTYTLLPSIGSTTELLAIVPGEGTAFETVRLSFDSLVALIGNSSSTIPGNDGREIELQKTTTHLQWRYVGDVGWTDLLALADIKGDKGDTGTGLTNKGNWAAATFNPGDYVFSTGSVNPTSMWVLSTTVPYSSSVIPKDDATNWIELAAPAGADGLSVELQKTGTAIQWRQVGGSWADLVLLTAITGPEGTPGTDGTNGTNGNTVLTTTGAPSGATGVNGDYALDVAAQLIYGPKAAGTWPTGVSIRGIQGTAGAIGSKWLTGTTVPAGGTGVNGDFYLRSNGDYYGPKVAGAWGAIVASLKGAAGSAIPAGGTTGQVLTKASAGDGDAIWQTPAAGGGGGGGASNISGNFTVPNDGVISWNIAPNAAGWGMVYLAALGSLPVTQFAFNTAGTPTIYPTLAGGGGVLTGVLTGTTGQTGKITVSVAAGKVYLENRMGWSVGITLFLSVAGTPA